MIVDQIIKKIPYMTAGQKKVADYICTHLEDVSYKTVSQIAMEVGVSETTVMRLSYFLDYSGFSEMQRVIREQVLGSLSNDKTSSSDQGIYSTLLDKDIQILQQTKKHIDWSKIDEAASLITKADKVFSVGFRTSEASAIWFYTTLSTLRDAVNSVTSSPKDYNVILNATPSSVVVAVSFSRYFKETIFCTEYMKKKQGAKLVVITDSQLSPLALIADIVFLTSPNKEVTGFNSQASAISILNLLLAGVVKVNADISKRINAMEDLYASTASFEE